MLQLNIKNETSKLRAVVLGIANSNGGIPKVEDCYDPKSLEHVKAGTYPKEEDMVLEMEAVAAIFKKYDVKVFRPEVLENYNQIFSRDIAFVIDLTQVGDAGSITMRYQGCAFKGLCYPPDIQKIDLSALNDESPNAEIISALNTSIKTETDSNESDKVSNLEGSEQYQLANMLQGDNLTLTLIAFFIGGLLLAFTPCVFPMYPILTGIIVGQGDQLSNKKAFKLSFIYVQGMAITYTALGIVVALAGAQFQAMFQHPAVLITLSIVFVLLALSMFGAYTLALPSSWQNKLNNLSNKQKGGSTFGVFVMGVISGLVASPCTTAPLTGALLYISQSGDVVLGASALYALSIGMGIPLLILGSSGGKLLPKAGNWMTIIKNIFGLLLLSVPIFLLERLIDESIVQLLWAQSTTIIS